MKAKFIVPAAVLLLAVSCGKDPGSGEKPEEHGSEETAPVTLHLSSSIATRTVLGEEEDGVYNVYWSDGDRICVNGVKSSMLTGVVEETGSASFTVSGVKAPYHVVYPSIRCTSMSEDGVASLSLPAVQGYVKGSFASGAAMLYGVSEGEEFTLKNLCGVVKIPVTAGSSYGKLLSSITISSSSADAPVCGSFSLDTTDGSIEWQEGAGSVLLSLPSEGVSLDSDAPEYFHICLPGEDYPEGFNIILEGPEGTMLCEWTEETQVPAGIMLTLPQIAFKPSSTKLIDDIDSWNEFAAAVNAGDYERWVSEESGEVNIVGDISYGGDLTPITALPAGMVLNGGGHVIRRAKATEPLIVLVSEGAVVKNLTVAGTRVAASTVADRGTGNLAAFNRGLIDNCTSEMAVDISGLDATIVLAGLVTDNAGTIQDSRNTGDITVSMRISANRSVYGGGISARGFRPLGEEQYCGKYIRCTNDGSITIYRNSTGNFSFTKLALGGIVGAIDDGDPSGAFCSIQDCTNNGSITCWQDDGHTNSNYSYSVGGILGRCCKYSNGPDYYYFVGGATPTAHDGNYVQISGCTNTGAIDVSIYSQTNAANMSGARQVYVGGIAGCLQSAWSGWASVSGCKSTGPIRTGHLAATDVTGGIIGGVGYVNISGCTADIAIGQSKNTLAQPRYMGLSGGILGYALRDTEVKDCEVALVFDKGTVTGFRGTGYVGAAAHHANLKEHVAATGYATIALTGTNSFSGAIDGVPVTADNVTFSGNEGKVTGTITIK